MHYTRDTFARTIQDALVATGLITAEFIELSEPKAAVAGDLALACFRAAKAQGTNPAKLAQELAAAVQFPPDSLVGGVAAAGPFLNFALRPTALAQAVLGEVAGQAERYGSDDLGAGKSALVEYSSPNVAKQMHVGHIRSTIIGHALNNILRALGYHTISDNHLGDWGKQFGTNIASIMRFGRPTTSGAAALSEIEQLYQRYNKLMRGDSATADEADEDTSLDDEARAWSLKLEQGDPTARELWQWMRDITLTANQRNYDRLGIHFDTTHGESFYEGMMAAVIAEAIAAGLATREAGGAVVVKGLRDEQGREIPTCLLQRSDGGTLYLTRDIATIEYREREYPDLEIVIYVVEQRQELHFRQVFALAKALGHAKHIQLAHVQFGTIFGANGEPLSTRKGNMVYLEALLDDAETRARVLIEAKIAEGRTELTHEEVATVSKMVGIGAVIYNDLYQDPRRNITLDWERMLAFEGNSAPYLQYTHARCCSILREATDQNYSSNLFAGLPAYDAALLVEPQEQAVLKQLARLPEAVRRAGQLFAPYVIAEWLYATAREFARFYRDLSVLKAASPEIRAARLALVAATAQGMRNGLALLGLQAPERM